jgi:hypothetical protein
MNLRTFFVINAVVALVYAIGLILAPAAMNATYGLTTDAGLQIISRFFGVELLILGVLSWLAKDFTGANARPILISGLVGNVVGTLVALMGTLGGVMGSLGWSAVLIYLLLGLAHAYFLFMKTS